jgi:hypothetical protein
MGIRPPVDSAGARPLREQQPRRLSWCRSALTSAIIAVVVAGCANPTSRSDVAPATQRLAIATSNGVFIWSRGSGLIRLGTFRSTTRNLPPVRLLSWSKDGRELAWLQQGSDTGPVTVHWARAGGSEQHSWYTAVAGTPPSAVIAQADGVTAFEEGLDGNPSVLRHYSTSGLPSSTQTIVEGPAVAAFAEGFVVIDTDDATNALSIYRVGLTGSSSGVTTPPGTGTVDEQNLENWAVSRDGAQLAAERGVEQDGCGFGPASKLVLIPSATGRQRVQDLPGNETWRFVTTRVSEDGRVDVVAANETRCQAANLRSGRDTLLPTRLFELSGGTVHQLASHVLVAERSRNGLLATISGDWRFSESPDGPFTEDLPTGRRRVQVGVEPVAVRGEPLDVRWSPSLSGGEDPGGP